MHPGGSWKEGGKRGLCFVLGPAESVPKAFLQTPRQIQRHHPVRPPKPGAERPVLLFHNPDHSSQAGKKEEVSKQKPGSILST